MRLPFFSTLKGERTMVKFLRTAGGYEVVVDDVVFGHLQQGVGFFTGPTNIKKYVAVSCTDLSKIASAGESVRITGYLPEEVKKTEDVKKGLE